jgi:cytochrome c-type biogenesis protein CcmH/NrfG
MDENKAARDSSSLWKPLQTYTLAVICLVIGLAIGYLLRGSAASPTAAAPETSAQSAQTAQAPQPQAMPSLDQMKEMADKKAAPLLEKLKTNPNDADTLNQLGTIYRATHQFKNAIDYYQKSLDINPKNVGARTDMASCMYYLGDVDGALAQLNKSLSYDPTHAGTLMNIGIMRWKGKNDVDGAIAAWEKALKLNPDPQTRQVLEHMIAEARQSKQPVAITGVKG